jgi:hypothetical protein
MAINKKLIHFRNKQKFEELANNDQILDASIVFIQDSKEISTHGTLYKTVNWSVLEISKVVTTESNPELQTALYSAGLVAKANYSTKEELAAITNE